MRATRLVAAILFSVPGVALANGDPRNAAVAALLEKTTAIAWSWLATAIILGLIVAFLKSGPTPTWNLAGFAWRAMLCFALLANYPTVFGTVIKTSRSIRDAVGADEAQAQYQASMRSMIERMRAANAAVAKEVLTGDASAAAPGWVAEKLAGATAEIGGAIFNALLSLVMLLGLLAHWVLGQLASILISLFYILGPLALMLAIPSGGGIALRWFGKFATYCTWPIISAILVALVGQMITSSIDSVATAPPSSSGAVAANSAAVLQALKGVATALVLVATAVSTPAIAGALVTVGAGNFAGHAAANAAGTAGDVGRWARRAAEMKAAAATGGASAAANAAGGAAAGAAGMGERTAAAVAHAKNAGTPGAPDVPGAAAAMLRQAAATAGEETKGAPMPPPPSVPFAGAPTKAEGARSPAQGSTTLGRPRPPPEATRTSASQAAQEANTRTSASLAAQEANTRTSGSQARREAMSVHERLEAELPPPPGVAATSPPPSPPGWDEREGRYRDDAADAAQASEWDSWWAASADPPSLRELRGEPAPSATGEETLGHVPVLGPPPASRPDAPTIFAAQDATSDGRARPGGAASPQQPSPPSEQGTRNDRR
ncbi:hypothetical protein [Pyxidicoccus sp. MSG2]|uniref:hypothetical protein n=1 Tax=Pyxidicoccus sp. MSG2 TaxID=2996790 RepID=UPI002270DCA2|nr:hypothetical protein [Pyxidicoccus sp. MSG2]MCY1023950.1 hypothetical protein [Pyxidicoccus sp. MSG2]